MSKRFNIIDFTKKQKRNQESSSNTITSSNNNVFDLENNDGITAIPEEDEGKEAHLLTMILKLKTDTNQAFEDQELLDLTKNFSNTSSMIFANEKELSLYCKNVNIINFIKFLKNLTNGILKDRFNNQKVLKKLNEIIEYWQLKIASLKHECFVVMYLDSQKRVNLIEESSHGFSSKAVVDSKKIIEKCIQISAHSIMLVHNHPSGNIEPSKDDIETTNQLVALLNAIGIEILDHIIISATEHFSFKKNFLI